MWLRYLELTAFRLGELWLRGPNVFKGYWQNEEATRNAITPDGFFKTGDVGMQDENHNFYISDRVKELIKWNGFQVPPAGKRRMLVPTRVHYWPRSPELEGVLLDCPLVEDVAVIGIYDEAEHTEVPRAYVVSTSDQKPSDDLSQQICNYVAERVAYYKKLRGGVRFIDTIPKSQAGKILRRVLKEMAANESKNSEPKAKLWACSCNDVHDLFG
jgi:4-coumarate--CoA ligase